MNLKGNVKMSKQNLNLVAQFADESTAYTQPIHKKYTSLIEQAINEDNKVSYETTEFKRINMAFTDPNYEIIQTETNRMGINYAFFLNTLIQIVDKNDVDDYINSLTIKRTKYNVARRKGNPSKRINLKFNMDTYQKLQSGSEQYNQTLTQYMNIIIEVYAQGIHI